MRRVNLFPFYKLAIALAPLKEKHAPDTPQLAGTLFPALLQAHTAMKTVLDAWRGHLGTSRASAETIETGISKLLTQSAPGAGETWATVAVKELEWWRLHQLADEIGKFETVLAEEAALINTYLADEKAAYSIARLFDDASVALPDAVKKVLPNACVTDFREAGRCLALDRFTAAGFHVLRALESTLVQYHDRLTGKTIGRGQRNWGAYTKALADANAPPELCGLLSQIKDHHRNPLMHPDDFLDEDEAIGLFDIAKSAIVAFAAATRALS